MSAQVQLPPRVDRGTPTLDDIFHGMPRQEVEDDPMVVWDKGVFFNELAKQGIVLSTGDNGAVNGDLAASAGLKTGTFKGTQMALTEIYSLLEESAVSHFDKTGLEPILPIQRQFQQKQDTYQWSDPSKDGYPPHLQTVPLDQQDGQPGVGHIFDQAESQSVSTIAKVLSFLIPDEISHKGTPYEGPTLAECEKYNQEHISKTDIMDGKNLGHLPDWYSDARFAQQHLSGVNPSTIEAAPPDQVKAYTAEAGKQGLDGMKKLLLSLSEGRDLFVQDYSYFRAATGVSDTETFQNLVPELDNKTRQPTGKFTFRYACAPVAIFQLHTDGRLHPLAITLDHRGSLDKSITIFNRRLNPNDKGGDVDEKHDWPWRYAKTCVQTADWARHEVAVHLVDTHMVEEAIIVATNRTIPDDHLVYELLSPHWFRTLALNAAARLTLVPAVIARLAGFGPDITPDPSKNRVYRLVDWSHRHFNFQDKYIPNDLKKRGFDIDVDGDGAANPRYRNYPYARDMALLWRVLRKFVATMLALQYHSDRDVTDDACIAAWCKEVQTHGQIPSFPTITTVDQLVDAVTMCIHTASPQHTAVNYLQKYYYGFVPAKPPALCTPLPPNLAALQAYTEKDLTAALPIGTDGPKWKDWLLAAQLPELLSFKVDNKYNLITYAKSMYNVNKRRTVQENKKFDAKTIAKASADFYSDLKNCDLAFKRISDCQTDGTVEYKVLQSDLTAVSILI
ncbi:hypothetical protein A1O3_06288 [Capronia epimyces CBS 606.96]|uniref:Manganese lipoxygenase n=1 Tax=Capronia epimyces CBS 606.96 TaxID=1182542 RepID=W9XYM7_9EURO|nr:uncharacterized protein A1O3_06288 [Capronia epimyces CBS 606.96]EXJ82475.1 hypothetical protein A1O3_06288 [Capronia epimyces CBS 606.96]